MPRKVEIQPPIGGVHRRVAVQSQPPFTCYDAQNVLPIGAVEGRARIAMRPGLEKTRLSAANFLVNCDEANSDGWKVISEKFGREFTFGLSPWQQPTSEVWLGLQDTNILWPHGGLADLAGNPLMRGRAKPFDLDTSEDYRVRMHIKPHKGVLKIRAHLLAWMDESNYDPDETGIHAQLDLEGTDWDCAVVIKDDGSEDSSFTDDNTTTVSPGWFELVVNESSASFDVLWRGTSLLSDSGNMPTLSDSAWGFGLSSITDEDYAWVDEVQLVYKSTQPAGRRTFWLGSTGTSATTGLKVEDVPGVMGSVNLSSSLYARTLSNQPLLAVPRLGKVYVADHGNAFSGSGDITISGGIRLDDTDVSDWTAVTVPNGTSATEAINSSDFVCVLSNSSGPTDGTHKILSVTSNYVTLATSMSAGTADYEIARAAKVYDPSDGTLRILAASTGKGDVPIGCPLIALYRDRIVLAGGQNWYMSRQGDPNDWDYSAEDTDRQRAVYGTVSDAGRIGRDLVAMAASGDDYMIFWTSNETWLLRGDPTAGGVMDSLSRVVGCVGRQAWCAGPSGEVYWLSHHGMYRLPRGGTAEPVSMSHEKMPDELVFGEYPNVNPVLAYDHKRRGVWIFMSPPANTSTANDTTPKYHWFYHLDTGGFWKIAFSSLAMTPRCVAVDTDHEVYLCAGDGSVYMLNPHWSYDDTTSNAVSANIVYGPFAPGGNGGMDGKLSSVEVELADGSGVVTCAVRNGETASYALDDRYGLPTWAAAFSWTVTDSSHVVHRPNLRGPYCALRIASTTTDAMPFVIDRIGAEFEPIAKRRPL